MLVRGSLTTFSMPARTVDVWNSMSVTPRTPNWNVTAVHTITSAYVAWPPCANRSASRHDQISEYGYQEEGGSIYNPALSRSARLRWGSDCVAVDYAR